LEGAQNKTCFTAGGFKPVIRKQQENQEASQITPSEEMRMQQAGTLDQKGGNLGAQEEGNSTKKSKNRRMRKPASSRKRLTSTTREDKKPVVSLDVQPV
jgi:hypothetical protein